MFWSRRFHLTGYLKASLWPVPVAGIIIGALLFFIADYSEQHYTDQKHYTFDASVTTALFAAIITATISFVGFVLTMLVLVIQFTGSSLSVRVLHFWYRDQFLKLSLGAFTVGLTYAFLMLTTANGDVRHGVTVYVGFFLLLFALILFLAFLSHLLAGIRPATLASHLAESGFEVIDQTYPNPFSGVDPPYRYRLPEGEPTQVILHRGPGQAIQAIHSGALVKLARQEDCTIALSFSVGDYVRTSGILAQVYGAKQDIPAEHIVKQIAAGAERTTDQDPGFLLRVLVDIAIKALSPAINDPTTATACIDRIEDLLTVLSNRDLDNSETRDKAGVVRLIVPCHTWDDYLWLGVTEVRIYGTNSIQTMRRMRLMLERLMRTAPEPRRPSIEMQMGLLASSAHAGFNVIAADLEHAVHVDLLRDDPGEAVL